MQVEKFPLRRLSFDVLRNVLRMMDGDQLISYSLISRATKQNVIDLKIKLRFFISSISQKLQILLVIPEFYRILLTVDENQTVNWDPVENGQLKLDKPGIVDVKCCEDYRQGYKQSLFLENRGISVHEWILHLFDIFHHPMITSLRFFEGCNRFDISFIRETIEGLNVTGSCFVRLTLDNSYKLMMGINKLTKKVMINNDLEPVEYLHKILIQNTENATFNSRMLNLEDTIPFRIDDIMANNSENIHMYCTISSDKDLNRFLKLWIKGAKPHLEYLLVGYQQGVMKDQLVIMKGIRYRVMGKDERRERPYPKGLEPTPIVAKEGSFLIRRKDGVEATVSFGKGRFMEFVVWNYL
ncbi:hypothetical protein CAEBREN_08027 [Caenorhabditis brenneri]|uniref:Sdz-33 F-box domain-containing protein n=1 Tax=Caenorhabditis brenneri TaxID=135651 RepID=G0N3I3_CAEBE|nr:hypothetical protein CAEBREN_08027 [Caenorhabditis brenneri]